MSNLQTRLLVQNEIDLLTSREFQYTRKLDNMLRSGNHSAVAVDTMIRSILTVTRTKADLIRYLEAIDGPLIPPEYGGRLAASPREQPEEWPALLAMVVLSAAALLVIRFIF